MRLLDCGDGTIRSITDLDSIPKPFDVIEFNKSDGSYNCREGTTEDKNHNDLFYFNVDKIPERGIQILISFYLEATPQLFSFHR